MTFVCSPDESGSDSDGAESTSSSYSSLSDFVNDIVNSDINGETPGETLFSSNNTMLIFKSLSSGLKAADLSR